MATTGKFFYADFLTNFFSDQLGGLAVGMRHDECKLFTTVASEHIGMTGHIGNPPGKFMEDVIAERMAAGIIDTLEVIEVHQQKREVGMIAAGPFNFIGQLLFQIFVIVQTGETVPDGLLL